MLALALAASAAQAATPSVEDALKLKPVQGNIPFEQPSGDAVARCTIKAEKIGDHTAWVVRGPAGQTLRQFADANGDNVVDTWRYFQNGLETYRDVDSDYNGKADHYRWYQTAGSRWGIDKDEDGRIDAWRAISPEETAAEVVAALGSGDQARFQRLLLSADDLKSIGFDQEFAEKLSERTAAAKENFDRLRKDKKISKDIEFTDFGGMQPGRLPQGWRGAKDDLLVYENAWAMVQQGDDHQQLQLGALVRVGDAWKLVDGPQLGSDQIAGGFFYTTPGGMAQNSVIPSATSEEMQQILADIEELDAQIASAIKGQQPKLHARRADLLQKLAASASTETEQQQWLTQLADMVSAAAQDGSYPQGIERLEKLEASLAKQKGAEELVTHFKFRRMQAENSQRLSDPKADYAKVHAEWLKELREFVEEHRNSPHAAEALLQLAMHSEFSSEEDAAEKYYRQIVEDFPQSLSVEKAQGAVTRLTSEGEEISLSGDSVRGGKIDLRQYRGKPVVIQYWVSSYPACKAEHAVLKELYSDYGGKRFEVLGVNLDYTREELLKYLEDNPLPWRQIHEPGGFDSRPANEMGVISLPLMLLLDKTGKVVDRSISAEDVEEELKKLF